MQYDSDGAALVTATHVVAMLASADDKQQTAQRKATLRQWAHEALESHNECDAHEVSFLWALIEACER